MSPALIWMTMHDECHHSHEEPDKEKFETNLTESIVFIATKTKNRYFDELFLVKYTWVKFNNIYKIKFNKSI